MSKATEDQSKVVEELAKYYGKSLEIFKEEEEEEITSPGGKRTASKKEKRGKSKKIIE